MADITNAFATLLPWPFNWLPLRAAAATGSTVGPETLETEPTDACCSSEDMLNHERTIKLQKEWFVQLKEALQDRYDAWFKRRQATLEKLKSALVLETEVPDRIRSWSGTRGFIGFMFGRNHQEAVPQTAAEFEETFLPTIHGVIPETLDVLKQDRCETTRLFEAIWTLLDSNDTIDLITHKHHFGWSLCNDVRLKKYTRVRFNNDRDQDDGYKAYVQMHGRPHEPFTIHLLTDIPRLIKHCACVDHERLPALESFSIQHDISRLKDERDMVKLVLDFISEEIDVNIASLHAQSGNTRSNVPNISGDEEGNNDCDDGEYGDDGGDYNDQDEYEEGDPSALDSDEVDYCNYDDDDSGGDDDSECDGGDDGGGSSDSSGHGADEDKPPEGNEDTDNDSDDSGGGGGGDGGGGPPLPPPPLPPPPLPPGGGGGDGGGGGKDGPRRGSGPSDNTNPPEDADPSGDPGQNEDVPADAQDSPPPSDLPQPSSSSPWKWAFLGLLTGVTALITAIAIFISAKYKQYKRWLEKVLPLATSFLLCLFLALAVLYSWSWLSSRLRQIPFWYNSVLVVVVSMIVILTIIYWEYLLTRIPERLLVLCNRIIKKGDEIATDIQTLDGVVGEVREEINTFKRNWQGLGWGWGWGVGWQWWGGGGGEWWCGWVGGGRVVGGRWG